MDKNESTVSFQATGDANLGCQAKANFYNDQREDTKDDTQEITRTNYLLPRL